MANSVLSLLVRKFLQFYMQMASYRSYKRLCVQGFTPQHLKKDEHYFSTIHVVQEGCQDGVFVYERDNISNSNIYERNWFGRSPSDPSQRPDSERAVSGVKNVPCFSTFQFAKREDENAIQPEQNNRTNVFKRLQSGLNNALGRHSCNLPKQYREGYTNLRGISLLDEVFLNTFSSQLASNFIKLLLGNCASEYRYIDYSIVNKASLNHKMNLKGPPFGTEK